MAIIYKFNVLNGLKERGYSTARLRSEKILSESVIQNLRDGKGISFDSLSKICGILDKQPSEIICYVGDDADAYMRCTDKVICAMDEAMSEASQHGWDKSDIASRILTTLSAYTNRVFINQ